MQRLGKDQRVGSGARMSVKSSPGVDRMAATKRASGLTCTLWRAGAVLGWWSLNNRLRRLEAIAMFLALLGAKGIATIVIRTLLGGLLASLRTEQEAIRFLSLLAWALQIPSSHWPSGSPGKPRRRYSTLRGGEKQGRPGAEEPKTPCIPDTPCAYICLWPNVECLGMV